jgi:hypothetical protein
VKKIQEQSGFGWDNDREIATAPNTVWDAYVAVHGILLCFLSQLTLVQKHPKLHKWRKTGFPLYDKCAKLFDGLIAMGEGAFHPGTQESQGTFSYYSLHAEDIEVRFSCFF